MGRGELYPGSSLLCTFVVMLLILSIFAFKFSNASRELTGATAPGPCSGRYFVLECPYCDTLCCESASPCYTPLGCRPGDCN